MLNGGTIARTRPPGVAAEAPGAAFAIAPEPGDDPATTAAGYFVYELAPGEAASGSVRLRNPGAAPVTVELAAVDAETARTGGSAFAAGAAPRGAGRWLRLDAERLTLAPGETASLAFVVGPPAGTAPGQYLAGLAAFVPAAPQGTPAAREENEIAASVVVQTRAVIGVQVDVPGAWTPSLRITGASALRQPSGTTLGIALRNDGDTLLRPQGSVTLRGEEASPLLEEEIALGAFLPGTEITYPIVWPGEARSGAYGIDVALTYADGKVAHYRGTIEVAGDAPRAHSAPAEPAVPAATPAREAAPEPAPDPEPGVPWISVAIAVVLGAGALGSAVALARRRPRW